MNSERSILLTVIAATLHVSAAVADEQSVPGGSPDWKEKKQTAEQEPRSFYIGIGGEADTRVSLAGLYRFRAAQRDSTQLQFLESWNEGVVEHASQVNLHVGYELTNWLDVELAWHGMDSFWKLAGHADVIDPTLSDAVAPRTHQADQYSTFAMTVYSLSLLPRWDINEYVAIFGRIGVGYADTDLHSSLFAQGWVSSTEVCNTDANGRQTCDTLYTYESRDWGDRRQRRTGIIPIVGIGIQLAEVCRLEYMLRADVPVGDTTTDVSSNLAFSFRIRGAWF